MEKSQPYSKRPIISSIISSDDQTVGILDFEPSVNTVNSTKIIIWRQEIYVEKKMAAMRFKMAASRTLMNSGQKIVPHFSFIFGQKLWFEKGFKWQK